MDKFGLGVMYLLRGFSHLFTPGLKRFIFLPIVFNLFLFTGLVYLLYHYSVPYAQYFLGLLPSWLHFLSMVFFILFLVSCFLLFLSMFTVLFNLIAAPFNGLLAEKAQQLLYGSNIPSLPFATIAWRSIKRQGQFVAYFLPRFLALCLLFFVPLVHPIYPILWFLFNAWVLSVQYQDFAADNNLVSFKEMRVYLKDNRLISIGFGTLINVISFIPILNVLLMPAAVLGGVMMYCEQQKQLTRKQQPLLVQIIDK